jgi:F-type H+-transporting ATPase subunit epsilon
VGFLGVLPGHAARLTTRGTGAVTYRVGREEKRLAVLGGFAEVQPERVIILAEVAEAPEEIDRARAERARQRAELRLSGRHPQGHEGEGEIDYNRALAALERALARIMVADRVPVA